jgi:hypothetical protein
MAVTYRQPVDDNVPWDQRLANYASNKDAGKSEYQRALEVYRGKSALGDTEGANAAKKWSDQVNTAIGGIGDNIVSNRTDQINKTTDTVGQKVNATPFEFKQTQALFQYNAQSDPSYQAALRQAQQGAQTATNNALVGLGSRGIGNSSVAVDRANQIQQSAIGNVNDAILPQLMQQAYGRYQDQNNNDYRTQLANYQAGQDQVKNLSGYAGTLNDLNQQEGNNQYRDKTFEEAVKSGNWNAYKDAVGMTGNLGTGPKSDWGQLTGQQGAPSYQSVQDAIKNGMSQQQIDNAAKQFAQQMGYNYDNMNANDRQAWAQIAISQQNANTSSANSARLAKGGNSTAETKSYKTNPEFAQDIADPETKNLITSNPQAYIDAYGYDGYLALKKELKLK